MKQISIIIDGTRYNAVHTSGPDLCYTCDLYDLCCKYSDATICNGIFGQDLIFKKAQKKKTYIFSNHYTHKRGNNYYHVEVEAETILEAKKKVREKYPDDVVFIKIK